MKKEKALQKTKKVLKNAEEMEEVKIVRDMKKSAKKTVPKSRGQGSSLNIKDVSGIMNNSQL